MSVGGCMNQRQLRVIEYPREQLVCALETDEIAGDAGQRGEAVPQPLKHGAGYER